MTTLPNISIVLPNVAGDVGTWGTELNAALSLLDAHDHTAGKGLRIKTAALSIDADLGFGGFFISALGKISFTAITAPVSGSKALFVNSADNELYWRTNAGTNVKLTSGASINTSLVGGIVGDYASVGAEVAYDDANDRYTFKQQSTKPWAKIACGDIKIFETGTTETVGLTLKIDPTLAANYTLTMPAALAGSQVLWQVDNTGVVSFSNTVLNLVTFGTGWTTSSSCSITGAGTLGVGGLITASAGVTCAANQSVTVSGTGMHKHAGEVLNLSAFMFTTVSGGSMNLQTGPMRQVFGGSGSVFMPIPLKEGDRITTVTMSIKGDGAADITNFEVTKTTSAGVDSSLGTTTSTNPAAAWADLTLNVTDTTLAAGDALTITVTSNAANIELGNVRVTYTRP